MLSLAYYLCSSAPSPLELPLELDRSQPEDPPVEKEDFDLVTAQTLEEVKPKEDEEIVTSTITSLHPNVLDVIINLMPLRDFLATSLVNRQLYQRINRYCKYRLELLSIYVSSIQSDFVIWKLGESFHVPETIVLEKPFYYEQVLFILETPQEFHFEKIRKIVEKIRERAKEIAVRIDGPSDASQPPWTISEFEWACNRVMGRNYNKVRAKRRAESELWRKAEMNCFCGQLDALDSFLREIGATSLALPYSTSPLALLTLHYISKMSLIAEIDYTAADLGSLYHQNRFLVAYDTPCRLVIRALILAAGDFFDLRRQIYNYESKLEEKLLFEDWFKANIVRDDLSDGFIHKGWIQIKKIVYVACDEKKIVLYTA